MNSTGANIGSGCLKEWNESGFSLLEILIASFIGVLAMTGLFYLYKAQNKSMLVQIGISELRMNGQYTLNEIQHYLAHAGLGLPAGFNGILVVGGDLVVRINESKKSIPASKDGTSTSTSVIYRISASDTDLFRDKAYAAAHRGNSAVEGAIRSIKPRAGYPSEALVVLSGDQANFPSLTNLFPLDRMRLHRCTGVGADTLEGCFKVMPENPGFGPGKREDSLTLAEGIESIRYRFVMANGDTLSTLPSNLNALSRVEIKVDARTRLRDPSLLEGGGFRRQTLLAVVAYRRSL